MDHPTTTISEPELGERRKSILALGARRKTINLNSAVVVRKPSPFVDSLNAGNQSLGAITGQETADDLILRFNEFYRHHKKEFDEKDSISTFAETPSLLIKNRMCRMVLMERLLATTSVCLWLCTLVYILIWFNVFFVWPMHFARDVSSDISDNKEYSITGKYTLLLMLTLHTYIPGTWGFIGTFCGREKVLKSFMLRIPWFLVIAFFYAVLAVKFVGSLSHVRIHSSMEMKMGYYYKQFDNRTRQPNQNSKDSWDVVQNYLRCCGIEGKEDWIKANDKLAEKFPASCCKTPENRKQRDKKKLWICMHGNGEKDVWKQGCKNLVFEFFILLGAGITGMGFIVCLLLMLSTLFAHRLYTLQKKIEFGSYKYPMAQYMIDFICMRRIYETCCNRKNKGKTFGRKLLKPTETQELYKNPIQETPSEKMLSDGVKFTENETKKGQVKSSDEPKDKQKVDQPKVVNEVNQLKVVDDKQHEEYY